MTNAERRVCLLEKAGDPPGKALPDWQIICLLARALGHAEAFAYRCSEEVFDEFSRCTAGRDLDMTGMTYAKLRQSGGLQWPMPYGAHTGTPRLYADGRFPTPSGRARFHAVELRAPSQAADRDYPFVLTTGRVKEQWHTRTRTGKIEKLNKTAPSPFVELNAADAGRLSIRSGDLIVVESRRAQGRLRAKVTRDIREGTVFAPMHWAQQHSEETAINRLTNDAFDPISKEPELKYTAVRIWRAE
jgi:ferredoxin-nitrate reductase